ncbi:uncharacterized protein LOC116654400 [Coturnix japonica]|uniref:uncharacterized protein LOC116654400 n=1 Tax=Coturnix japonica TaxID=93934 RepID=UPI0013A5DE32|nr:uncharacterized protein LOC116654400 [Coturnix japonica]
MQRSWELQLGARSSTGLHSGKQNALQLQKGTEPTGNPQGTTGNHREPTGKHREPPLRAEPQQLHPRQRAARWGFTCKGGTAQTLPSDGGWGELSSNGAVTTWRELHRLLQVSSWLMLQLPVAAAGRCTAAPVQDAAAGCSAGLLCRTLQLDAVLGSCAGCCSWMQCWAPVQDAAVGRSAGLQVWAGRSSRDPPELCRVLHGGSGQVLQGAEITEILLLGRRGTFPHGAARPGAARGPSGAGRAPGAAGSLMETFCAGARGSFNGDGPSGAPSRLLWALLSQRRTQQSPPPNPPQPLSELWVQSPPGCEEGLSCPPPAVGSHSRTEDGSGILSPPSKPHGEDFSHNKKRGKKRKKTNEKGKRRRGGGSFRRHPLLPSIHPGVGSRRGGRSCAALHPLRQLRSALRG